MPKIRWLIIWMCFIANAISYIDRANLAIAAPFIRHELGLDAAAMGVVLSAFFWFLTLWAYAWYAERPGWRRYGLALAAFGLGLMSKPQVITLPFVLLLWDYWPLRRFSFGAEQPSPATPDAIPSKPLSTLIGEKVPLLFLCAISGVMTMRAQAGGGATCDRVGFDLANRI